MTTPPDDTEGLRERLIARLDSEPLFGAAETVDAFLAVVSPVLERLRAERDEWKQVAEAEADLADEFKAGTRQVQGGGHVGDGGGAVVTEDDTEGLRERIKESFGPAMRLGLQDAELHDEPGAQRIEEWINAITDAVLAVLVEPPGDLPARMTAELDRHNVDESEPPPATLDANQCTCGELIKDWRQHLAEVALSVRWEDAARRIAAAEARADEAERQRNARAADSFALAKEMQQKLERAIEAEAQVAAIRSAVVNVYGEDYGDEDVPAAVERLMRHLSEYEADVLRLRQSKNEALEASQAQVAALQRDLAEARMALDDVAGWETSQRLNAETARDDLRARLLGAAIHARRLKTWAQDERASVTVAGSIIADLFAALGISDMPSRPDVPEEIRRLAQATTEETTNDEH